MGQFRVWKADAVHTQANHDAEVFSCDPRARTLHQILHLDLDIQYSLKIPKFQELLKFDIINIYLFKKKYLRISVVLYNYIKMYIYIYYIRILYILYTYTIYIQYIYIHNIYILYIYTMYILYIYSIYILHIYTIFILYIITIYILYIYYIYTIYVLYIYVLYIYTLYIYTIYTIFILYIDIYYIYTIYILYIYTVYTETTTYNDCTFTHICRRSMSTRQLPRLHTRRCAAKCSWHFWTKACAPWSASLPCQTYPKNLIIYIYITRGLTFAWNQRNSIRDCNLLCCFRACFSHTASMRNIDITCVSWHFCT